MPVEVGLSIHHREADLAPSRQTVLYHIDPAYQ